MATPEERAELLVSVGKALTGLGCGMWLLLLMSPVFILFPPSLLLLLIPIFAVVGFQKTLCIFVGLVAGLATWFGALIFAIVLTFVLDLDDAGAAAILLLLTAAALGLYAGWKIGINVGANMWVKQLRWQEEQRARLGQ